ncbi:hypothetical protein OLMES_2955 [Oleiphilus messinensis]|uniref:Uncharacterized protein n=1 Tax=Oleiphilus messinensis TaxID=141451 RepID=A0A1Y0IA10_9GAMM|nr:hypothetical protein OLMES_2955 [Oleiphilus messinensis]
MYPKEAVSTLKIEAFVPTHIDWQYFDTNSFTQLRLGLVPSDDLTLKLEAITQMLDNEQMVIREVLESLIIKYQSRRWDSGRHVAKG